MKKFFGFILGFLAFVFMTVAMTAVSVELLYFLDNWTEAPTWIAKITDWLFLKGLNLYAVTAAVWVVLIGIGAILNHMISKKARGFSFFLTFLFGLGAYGTAMYFVVWGPLASEHIFLSEFALELAWLTRDIVMYGGAGLMLVGCLLSLASRKLWGKPKAKPARSQVQVVPEVADTDLAYTSSRQQKKEVYVRDPWGNFIRQEDYDERVNRSRNQKF